MNVETPFYVVSAEADYLPATNNEERTRWLATKLRDSGQDHKLVRGVYNGAAEHAFIVLATRSNTPYVVDTFARLFRQESILYIDANRQAYIGFLPERGDAADITWQPLGTWREADRETAEQAGAYTLEPDTGRTFIAA